MDIERVMAEVEELQSDAQFMEAFRLLYERDREIYERLEDE